MKLLAPLHQLLATNVASVCVREVWYNLKAEWEMHSVITPMLDMSTKHGHETPSAHFRKVTALNSNNTKQSQAPVIQSPSPQSESYRDVGG